MRREAPGDLPTPAEALATDGFTLLPASIDRDRIETARSIVDALLADTRYRGGLRGLLRQAPALGPLIVHPVLRTLRDTFGCAQPRLVRSILFDKRPDANWSVAWHQDTKIPVRARHDLDGFGGWTRKDGIWHTQPPPAILANMLTARLHLDDTDTRNGALSLIPGSHVHGIIPEAKVPAYCANPVSSATRAGDLLVMRPLTLHASDRCASDRRRRVIHLECAFTPLPEPCAWALEETG